MNHGLPTKGSNRSNPVTVNQVMKYGALGALGYIAISLGAAAAFFYFLPEILTFMLRSLLGVLS